MTGKQRLVLAALILIVLFPAGALWSINPWLWSLDGHSTGASAEQVRSHFKVRLAPLQQASPLRRHVIEIEKDGTAEVETFDGDEWVSRECRHRLFLCLVLYAAAGLFVHVFVIRVMRGQEEI
jgi:hypothetical protein